MRVDKWIWAVRMVKSRTLAGHLCRQGKVEINGQKAKPASLVRLDDIVIVDTSKIYKQYKVTGLILKRVSAELAAQNYEDLTPETPQNETEADTGLKFWGQRVRGEGRPTKKDWRDIDKAKNQYE